MIKIEQISKKFNDLEVLKQASIQLPKGETIALIGPSGSGKSTLIRCINHLEQPDSGNIFIDNELLSEENNHKITAKIAMVFQHFNLFPHMNVLENLIYSPIKVNGLSRVEAIKKAKKLLDLVCLSSKENAKINELSGGQKQRIAIARALMMEPEIILFDEPTSALDPETIKDIVDIINNLKQQNISMIIVTHHINFAKKIADRIIFMDQGHILESSSTKDFFTKPKSMRAKLFLENIAKLN